MKILKKSLTVGLVVLALASHPASASFGFFSSGKPSSLPLEAMESPLGRPVSNRAFETGNRLYVVGDLQNPRGRHISSAAHVDVQLLGRDDQILAEKRVGIAPFHPRVSWARTGHHPYVASFPIGMAHQATKVRVKYHLSPHDA
ncbi:MAG: hypothetical protein IAE94_14310 [Chthoniobacterales bacterium]|nr:hypothetical protein [Chthoniobacterales bacterium]